MSYEASGRYEEWRLTGDAGTFGPYLCVFPNGDKLRAFVESSEHFRRNVSNVKAERRKIVVSEWVEVPLQPPA